jgi:hypothetical protein
VGCDDFDDAKRSEAFSVSGIFAVRVIDCLRQMTFGASSLAGKKLNAVAAERHQCRRA